MADLGSPSWSEIDASNNAVPPDGWPEGMQPSDVNNSARSQMGGEKRWWDRSNSTQTTTGTSTAYVLTYAATESALYDGEETSFVLHATCGAAPTLNRDGLGAKALRKFDFATDDFIAVVAGDFRINQALRVRYNLAADRYDVISASDWSGAYVRLDTDNVFTGKQTFEDTATMTGAAFDEAKGADIPSATTTDIGAVTGNYVHITGTTTITGLGTIQAGTRRKVVFDGILILTHNGTSLILPTGANITTAPGDCAEFESEGSGNWRCTSYERANGLAVAPAQPTAQAYVTIVGGVVTIQKQTGFASIVRDAVGLYTCTLSTPMPDANYVVLTLPASDPAVTTALNRYGGENQTTPRTTTVFHIFFNGDNAGNQDPVAFGLKVYA